MLFRIKPTSSCANTKYGNNDRILIIRILEMGGWNIKNHPMNIRTMRRIGVIHDERKRLRPGGWVAPGQSWRYIFIHATVKGRHVATLLKDGTGQSHRGWCRFGRWRACTTAASHREHGDYGYRIHCLFLVPGIPGTTRLHERMALLEYLSNCETACKDRHFLLAEI